MYTAKEQGQQQPSWLLHSTAATASALTTTSVYTAQQRNTTQSPLGLILLCPQAEGGDEVEALARLDTVAWTLVDPATLLVLQGHNMQRTPLACTQ